MRIESDYFSRVANDIDCVMINELNLYTNDDSSVQHDKNHSVASGVFTKKIRYDSTAHNEKIVKRRKGYGYGLFCSFLGLVILDGILMLAYFSYNSYAKNSAAAVQNMVELNLAVTELWNIHMLMETSLNAGIMWQNKTIFMNSSPEKVYRRYSQYFKEVLIPKFVKIKGSDLGAFSSYYENITSYDYSLCKGLKEVNKANYTSCGEGQSAFVNSNLIIFLKGLVAIMDQTADQLSIEGDAHARARMILSNPNFMVYQAYALVSKMISDVYYLILFPLNSVLVAELSLTTSSDTPMQATTQASKDLASYMRVLIPATIVYLALVHACFMLPFIDHMRHYWQTPRIMTLGMIERNSMLYYYMNKVESGTKRLLHF